MSKCFFIAMIALCVIATSCFPPPPELFLHALDSRSLAELNVTEDELKNVQFYLCGHILLEREVDSQYESQVSPTHKVIPREGKFIEQIEIQPETPGIDRVIGPLYEYMEIAFDPESPNETLRFMLKSQKYYELSMSGAKEVLYEGKAFINKDKDSARLCIENGSLENLRKKHKALPGIKLEKRSPGNQDLILNFSGK